MLTLGEKKETNNMTFLTVDNPAGGNCAFYAYAIALIDIIRREFRANDGRSRTFNTWCRLDLSVRNPNYINAILEFDYKDQNIALLNVLQTSLRQIVYEAQLRQLTEGEQFSEGELLLISLDKDDDSTETLATLQQAARQTNNPILIKRRDKLSLYVDPQGYDRWIEIELNNINIAGLPFDEGKIGWSDQRLSPELLNIIKSSHAIRDIKSYFQNNPKSTVFIRFAEIFYNCFKNLPPKPDNDFAHSRDILTLVSELKARLTNLAKWYGALPQKYIDYHLAHLFLNLVYGDNYDKPERKLQADSKIVNALKQVLQNSFWGTHYHLNLLSEIFDVNFHCLENDKAKYEFRDSAGKPTITINNVLNYHWTTLIPIFPKNNNNSMQKNKSYIEESTLSKNEIQAIFQSYTTGFNNCFFSRNHMKKAQEIIAACQDKQKTVANIIGMIFEYRFDPNVKFNPNSSFIKSVDFILRRENHFKKNDINETLDSNCPSILRAATI
jgi:hypothetical protein